ncbi:sugar phosphate isomerase/epimerase [Scopulibacillus darangshiensis]|uniref:Sugar phosphate isomerase/epimerase n=1 Tax=Scopulibacillus darangshiensis TaxID=442528 RepID=A0A4R2PAA1_9BACL|nr:sugar phosphate isomerase/epimerase family protein [Scopulibacillus darangshiensis]TCP30825.1 sugar phosphate isomerase/epimerase [Scopulibacillus darangshiensis]
MKIGLSSYSLLSALQSGEITILDAIQWTADQGGEHIELVPMGFSLEEDPSLIDAIRQKAEEADIDISNYAISADFIKNGEGFENEISRVKKQVDIAHQLGVKLMRHDVAWRSPNEATASQFESDLPKLGDACGQIADYAKQYGITTSIENHGFYIQASRRVQRLIDEVDRSNFKTTLDVGNFMCVDEDSVAAVKRNISYASMVHLKDFYLRAASRNPGEGWFQTAAGNHLRGAIVGHGDIDMRKVISAVKASGYDGYISVEFEGLEDCRKGSRIGMNNARRLWEEATLEEGK